MAGGWTRDGAVQEQIESTVEDEIERIRGELPEGESLTHCAECGEAIPRARRKAVPGVRLCIECQQELDERRAGRELFNRRASKDSQLR